MKTVVVSNDETADRLRAFGEELDALKKRILAKVGAEDVARVKRLDRFSRAMEVVGRVLIHVSPEPITFTLGVVALWLHKQLQATEIGHTSLHGAYDGLEGAEKYASRKFRWDVPIDEESWLSGHNVKHHGNTNVAGRDPDIDFGTVRLTRETPYAAHHRWQLPMTLFLIMPNFAFFMNPHFTGLNDALLPNGSPKASKEELRVAWKKTLRKYVPYYLKNYVFFPALAGPMFWKVMLGNFLAETMRDLYSSATIFCGHVGPETKAYPKGTRPKGRGQWYAMQIEGTNNFEVSRPISILCGGLDRQIEHHLFPTLPPNRLREISPEVKALCAKYGVTYRTDTWPRTLVKALAHIKELANDGGPHAVLREMA